MIAAAFINPDHVDIVIQVITDHCS